MKDLVQHSPGDHPEGSDRPEPNAEGFGSEELRGVSAEGGRHLHPLAPLVFAATGIVVGFLAAYVFGPELGVALGLLGGGLGVWIVERGRRLR